MSGTRKIGVALVGCALAISAETLSPLRAAAAETLNPPSQAAATPQDAAQAVPDNPVPDSAAPASSVLEGGAMAPRPFDGSLGAGLAEVRRLTEAEDVDGALAVAERLLAPDPAARVRAWLERRSGGLSERPLAWFDGSLAGPLRALGLDPGTSAERAEVHYARGVALRAAARAREAREAYDLVRGLGGAARPDAVYELGHLELLAGEGWRSQIPELAPAGSQPPAAQAPAAQQPPGGAAPGGAAPGGAAPGAGGPDEPDPLQEARRAYQSALAAFVERLRLDWRDADTRANVELVRRRLRELDELEQKRKEQQQEQKDQQQGDKQDQQQDPKQDQQQKDPEQQDPEQQDPQQQDPQAGETEPPEPEEGEQPKEEPAPEEEQPPTPEPEEGQLTKEQLQRLQQLLEQNRQLGEEIDKALRQRSRGRTARDW